MSEKRRCKAKANRTGEQCRMAPIRGLDVCRVHGGSAPRARAAGKRNVAMAEAMRLVDRAGVDLHPIEHLLDSLYRAAAEVQVYGQMVGDLDNQGEVEASETPGRLRGWAERRTVLVDTVRSNGEMGTRAEIEVDADPLLVRVGEDKVALHPFVVAYDQALERRAKFAKLALDAGVAERQVQLAESQAIQLAEAIRSILTELGVKQDRRVVSVVQKQLRALSGPPRGTS